MRDALLAVLPLGFFQYLRCPPHRKARLRRTFNAGPDLKWPGVWVWVKPRNGCNLTSSLFTVTYSLGGPRGRPQAGEKSRKEQTQKKNSRTEVLLFDVAAPVRLELTTS